MTHAVQELLTSFERLSSLEQNDVLRELMRRASVAAHGDLTDDELTQCAELLFLELDKAELADG